MKGAPILVYVRFDLFQATGHDFFYDTLALWRFLTFLRVYSFFVGSRSI